MKTSSILDTYQTWLTHREYSPATIQKYTKALARFFADTGAGDIPTRETVAAWRDSLTEKGYTPATVNAMLAAVNDYQESIDNVAGKAKPLKHQRRIFADPGRELTRAEYFRLLNAARAAGNKRTQLLLEALCSTGTRVSELQFITAEAVRRHKASIRCKGKALHGGNFLVQWNAKGMKSAWGASIPFCVRPERSALFASKRWASGTRQKPSRRASCIHKTIARMWKKLLPFNMAVCTAGRSPIAS